MPAVALTQLSVKQPLAEAYTDEAYDVVVVPLSGGRALAVWEGRTDSYPVSSTDMYAYIGCRIVNSDGSIGPHVLAWKSPLTGDFSGTTDYQGYDDNYGLAASSDGNTRVLVVMPIYRYSAPGLVGVVEYNLLVLLDCSTSTPTVLDTVYDTYRAGSPCTCISGGAPNSFLLLHDDGAAVVNTSSGTISVGSVQQTVDGAAGRYGEFMSGWCDGSVGVIKFNSISGGTGFDYARMFPFTISGGVITWGTPLSGGDVKGDGSGVYVFYYPGGCDMARDGHDFVMVGGAVADVYPARGIKLTSDGHTISFVAMTEPFVAAVLNAGWANSQTRYDRAVATGTGAFAILFALNSGDLIGVFDAFGSATTVDFTNAVDAGSQSPWLSLDAVSVGGRVLAVGDFGTYTLDPTYDDQVWCGFLTGETPSLTGAGNPGKVYFW